MKKFLLVGLGIAALAALGAAVWYMSPVRQAYYSDADTIREPADTARVRDILWQPPVRLADVLNTGADDYEPRVSWDGLTVYFVRGKAGENADIFTAQRTPQGWTDAAPLAALNSEHEDLGPQPTADGRSIYFYSDRPGGCGGYDLWVSHLGDSGWQAPVNLGPTVNSEFNDYGPAVAPAGDLLYFASNRPQPDDAAGPNPDAWPATVREDLYRRDYDLYVSAITDAGFGPAAALTDLNSSAHEGAPVASPVGDFLYFASDRPGGAGGFDIYRARRLDGAYLAPENLGRAVNTPANELDPGLTMGGFALFFSSDRPARRIDPDRPNDYDLYLTHSREVFRDVDERQRAGIDWGGLWDQIGPNILWALLALLLLLLLLRLFNEARMRRLSLLTRCLLASLVAHALLMLLFNFWEVTATMAGLLGRSDRVKVSLASSTGGVDIAAQVRGFFTHVDVPAPSETSVERLTEAPPLERADASAQLPIERVALSVAQLMPLESRADDSQVRATAPPALQPPLPPPNALLLAAAGPQDESRQAGNESPPPRAPAASLTSSRSDAAAPIRPIEGVPETIVAPLPAPLPVGAAAEADGPGGFRSRQLAEAPAPALRSSVLSVTLGEIPAPSSGVGVSLPAVQLPSETQTPQPESAVSLPPAGDFARRASLDLRNTIVGAAASVALMPASRPVIDVTSSTPLPNEILQDATPAETALPAPPLIDALFAGGFGEPGLSLPPAGEFRAAPSMETPAELVPDAVPTPRRVAGESPPLVPPSTPYTAFVPAASTFAASALPFELPPAVADAQPLAALPAPRPRAGVDASAALLPHGVAAAPVEIAIPEPMRDRADSPSETPAEAVANPSAPVPAPPALARPPATAVSFDPPRMKEFAPAAAIRPSLLAPAPRPDQPLTPDAPAPRTIETATPVVIASADSAARALTLPDVLPPDLALPNEFEPVENPFEQRAAEQRTDVIQRMGGSDRTERAVAMALDWLARHQSDDGRWDGGGFDAACGRCGGQTAITADIGLTGLSLLAFLGADHTHFKDGPYRAHVNRGLLWLLQQQRRNGDLRGDETMYSHAIAAIALSEAYAMTGDPRLRDAVARAIDFIDKARNPRDGGWRYDPGQPGDTSVLGWQVMALKSARLAGFEPPYASLNAARRWLDAVSEPGAPGLYAYQPGQSPTPSMTAEGMFVQQLLGAAPDDPRMSQSADYLMENLPDWDSQSNTYYWYYATLAMFQHQGPQWERWNEAVTRELLRHQITDGPAAGSWDPAGEWALKGGRIYQTALGALMFEVYYRYLPLYSAALSQPPDDAIGAIRGRVVDRQTNQPLAGAAVRLDLPQRDSVTATTDAQGVYVMFAPRVPDHFAVSASKAGFVPASANVAASQLRGAALKLDFSLERESADVVAVEPVPDVHHLGNNRFEGRINSQFQKSSEGRVHDALFTLTDLQVVPYIQGVEIRLMAKGVQCPHIIRINGRELDARLDQAPPDGSFGEFVARIDPAWLRQGDNRLQIEAVSCRGDLDDFEFVNVQFHLQR